jgi:phosphoenolpyruvate-protein phosphotransferase/dihydroxyacetone kinase phosphotransfer subunit
VVGIVIVSHSHRLAEGVSELAREMGGPDVRIETAGGLDLPDHPIGTDAVLVQRAIERAWSDDGVLVLMDLGSAVLSAEMALELLGPHGGRREKILLCEAPLVEGAVAAAVTAKMGGSLEAVAAEARGGLAGKLAHLGTGEPEADLIGEAPPEGQTVSVALNVRNRHGLHARPAARFVQTAAAFDARVRVRNLTNGRGPADAASLNGVAMLGVSKDHEIEVSASGPGAAEALQALQALAARDFDETQEPEPPADSGDGQRVVSAAPEGSLQGYPASPGVAMGRARRFQVPELEIPADEAADPQMEGAVLERAIAAAREDIAHQRDLVAARAGEAQAQIFDAHLLFLHDEALLGPARRAINEARRTSARAWHDAVQHTAAAWDALEDDYLRARAADLRSVGAQVLAHILGQPMPEPVLATAGILIAPDLTPADTAGLDRERVLGIVTAHGGPTSHAAVLARSLGIPAVVGVGELLAGVSEGTALALDGGTGVVYLDPDPALVNRLRGEQHERDQALDAARELARSPAVTIDGVVIEVAANVARPQDVSAAVTAGADGVGLFRTEFLFMGRDDMPDEDEQTAAYTAAAEALDGRPLLLRTLDAGADKPIPYLGQAPEANPFLGVRGIRLGLQRPALLDTQLRAIVRVSLEHRLRVMFPMISTLEEVRQARAALDRARAALGARAELEVGIMVEVPAAALTAGLLAAEVDFFSIGTNDLTQYTLAADRGNEHVAALTDALHPAVLRLIRSTVEGARGHGRWVGVCGELGGDALATSLLLGLGVSELSMSAPSIASVKQAVRATDADAARRLADRALGCATAAQVRELLATG